MAQGVGLAQELGVGLTLAIDCWRAAALRAAVAELRSELKS